MSNTCEMCGKQTVRYFRKWYRHDNGQQFIARVCYDCAHTHERLVERS